MKHIITEVFKLLIFADGLERTDKKRKKANISGLNKILMVSSMKFELTTFRLGERPKNPKCLFLLYRYLLINTAFFENLANARRTLLWCQIPFQSVTYYPPPISRFLAKYPLKSSALRTSVERFFVRMTLPTQPYLSTKFIKMSKKPN